ncbi:NAD(P)/FAD-dependent oxidoreductase [Sphingomonas sp. CLY1604]|uniref:NAD(P)/FAD-dependent oxidoreductase n=1 Tax=Sphingomonas sp. CLY1604 TaxID=3457786 RepID=UPI003FD7D5C9
MQDAGRPVRTIVIGGGVIGLSCAVRLAQAGRQVTLMEADGGSSAPSWNNAGHIAVEQVAPLASLANLRALPRRHRLLGGPLDLPLRQLGTWLPFALRFVAAARPARFRAGQAALRDLLAEAMPAWQRLAALLDTENLVRQDGHVIHWDTAASADRGHTAWTRADTGTACFVKPTMQDRMLLETLTGEDVFATRSARFTGSGHIDDLDALACALRRRLVALGGIILTERAVLATRGALAAVDGHDADDILITAGIDSSTLLRPLGHRVPLIAERGYHIRAAADDWPRDAPPVVFEDRSMIVTRFADCVQASSFVELAAADAPPDPRKWARLEEHVRALRLPMTPPFTRWMGARPTLPDYLPALGSSQRAKNLFYAFGHQHLGLTLAAVTAERMTTLMSQKRAAAPPSFDLTPFDLARFDRSMRR